MNKLLIIMSLLAYGLVSCAPSNYGLSDSSPSTSPSIQVVPVDPQTQPHKLELYAQDSTKTVTIYRLDIGLAYCYVVYSVGGGSGISCP